MFYSPLRYPGGKNKLSKFIAQICIDNNINGHYIEPYAGGASVALYLLLEGKVKEITINDFDRSIYAFWYSVLKHTNKLCKLIQETEINIENWKKAKDIQKNKDNVSLLELGFSTLFLNRTNISGIINAGVIGGVNQTGNYKIDCRFNKIDIIEKIKKIAKYKNNIHVLNLDAIKLLTELKDNIEETNTILYFDPPYYLKGSMLYMNSYKEEEHIFLANKIREIKNIKWIVSYDNTQAIEDIYNWVDYSRITKYTFNHSAYRSRKGNEILFFSNNLDVSLSILENNKSILIEY